MDQQQTGPHAAIDPEELEVAAEKGSNAPAIATASATAAVVGGAILGGAGLIVGTPLALAGATVGAISGAVIGAATRAEKTDEAGDVVQK